MIYNVGGGGATSAKNISYDNTDSHLQAENVQDAIDEISDSSVYFDEDTDTLYINTSSSNYTYDSTNQILYVG